MGIFDRVDQEQFDKYKSLVHVEFGKMYSEFEKYKNITQNQFDDLQNEVKANATVSDETAREAAVKAVESKNNIKNIENSFGDAFDEIIRFREEAKTQISVVSEIKIEAESRRSELENIINQVRQNFVELTEKKLVIDQSSATISGKVEEFNLYLEKSKDLPNSLEETRVVLAECKKLANNIQDLLNHSLKRKAEIDELHKGIYGVNISNSAGEVEHVSGLKDELENSYNDLFRNISLLEDVVKKSVVDISSKFDGLLKEKLEKLQNLLDKSKGRFEAVNTQLTGLLPGGWQLV
ncbi:hypothetical protein AAKU55_002639 [Oxalobacteraceae bacterium GrIS 1.11]